MVGVRLCSPASPSQLTRSPPVMCWRVQVITGSHDTTVRLWDLRKGVTSATLTHHKKSVRALVGHPREYTFASAAADNIKKWKLPDVRGNQRLVTAAGTGGVQRKVEESCWHIFLQGGDLGLGAGCLHPMAATPYAGKCPKTPLPLTITRTG